MPVEHFDTYNNVCNVIKKNESNVILGLSVSYGAPFVQNMCTRFIGVFPKWNENLVNSRNLINH